MWGSSPENYVGDKPEWEFDEDNMTWRLERCRMDGGALGVKVVASEEDYAVICGNFDELKRTVVVEDVELERAMEIAEWVVEIFPEGWLKTYYE